MCLTHVKSTETCEVRIVYPHFTDEGVRLRGHMTFPQSQSSVQVQSQEKQVCMALKSGQTPGYPCPNSSSSS